MDLAHLARRVKGRAGRELRARRAALLAQQVARAESETLVDVVGRARGAQARRLEERQRLLLTTLGVPVPAGDDALLPRAVEEALAGADRSRVWLALAVLTGRLPLDEDVVETHRRLRLDGPGRALAPNLRATTWLLSRDRHRPVHVEVVTGATTVDVHHTSQTDLATGIQRVARETARRWHRDHTVELVGWTADYTALRRLDAASLRRATGGHGPDAVEGPEPPLTPGPDRDPLTPRHGTTVVVPWSGCHLTLELATEEPRTARMLALARHSGNRTGVIGFDTVPLTSAETAGEGMGGAFAKSLAAVREMDRVATISEGAAVEYRGWREMLAGAGLPGPGIEAVSLPVAAGAPTPAALAEARSRFTVGSLPMVLVVGSHEPRKNHLAVLHAAEVLWRRGVQFSLVLVGGNAWKSERFTETLSGLRGAGRPIDSVRGLSDDVLWAAYRLAAVVLFPSLNEGFGLPVAEGLASGTPVITSRYGSMAEIAAYGGALLVDPRDDHDIARALEQVLTEPRLHAELAAQAAARPLRTWDDYARDLWQYLAQPADQRAESS